MKKKFNKNIILSITCLVIMTLLLLGLTYAYYRTRIIGNKNINSISITSAKLELVYNDNSAEIIKNPGGIIPSSDLTSKGAIGSKTFTVTNNGIDSSYVVIIDNVNATKAIDGTPTTFVSNDFRYKLTCTKSDNTNCNDASDLTIFPINGGILVGNSIAEGDIHTYTFTLWYIDTEIDQSDDMGKSLQARINISDVSQMENPFKTGVSEVDNVSLAYNILENTRTNKNGTTFVNTPLTTPAEEINAVIKYKTTGETATVAEWMPNLTTYRDDTWYYYDTYEVDPATGKFTLSGKQSCTYNSCYSNLKDKYLYSTSASDNTNASYHRDNTMTNLSEVYKVTETEPISLRIAQVFNSANEAESVLASTPDDYGISYYYRGDVVDNYVNFAGMCWRIVRIAGDGSTKLILEDQYSTCDKNGSTYTGNWSVGNGYYGSNNYGKHIISYLKPEPDVSDSMVKAFYDFQTNQLKDYTNKLKSGDWCLGDKAYSRNYLDGSYTYSLLEEYNPENLDTIYYDAYTRLSGENANGYIPTLKCKGTKLSDFETVKESGITIIKESPMFVGAITADEITYAGGKYVTRNVNYYLLNYSQAKTDFISLSPSRYVNPNYHVGYVRSDGALAGNDHVAFYPKAFRPMVSLLPNAVITGGEGTIENPYVIG